MITGQNGVTRRDFIAGTTAAGVLLAAGGVGTYKLLQSGAKGKIVIIGGGAAGMSMAARLARRLPKADITLIDPSEKQIYQPGFTLIAAGVYRPDEVWKNQSEYIPRGVKWVKESVIELNPDTRKVMTVPGNTFTYDFLVLTPGLQINWNLIEGMTLDTLGQGNAHSIYDFGGAVKTWTALQDFGRKGGKALFTDTYTKHKCGGAPKKICLLTEHHLRRCGTREKSDVHFLTAAKELYDVKYYTPRLLEIYKERKIPIVLNTRIKGIDIQAKKIHLLEPLTGREYKEDYDFLHFTPPMSAPDFILKSGLSILTGTHGPEGWVDTDKHTLLHTKYANIICLGDVAGLPTSKTSAAVRKQVPIAVANLLARMEGRVPSASYDGYAACPIVTDYGHVLLCEFNYDKKPETSLPFRLFDTSKELHAAWLLKVYGLKPMYFHGMLRGLA